MTASGEKPAHGGSVSPSLTQFRNFEKSPQSASHAMPISASLLPRTASVTSVRREAVAQFDDAKFALELLERESVLVVPGTGFNFAANNHFRITLLPQPAQLRDVFARIERVLARQIGAGAQRERSVA